MKYFGTPRPIEQTPTKLPVNIKSNNEIKHNVACYRCIFINHNIVHNKTNSVQNQFCRNKQEAIYYVTVTLSYDKKSFRNAYVHELLVASQQFSRQFPIKRDLPPASTYNRNICSKMITSIIRYHKAIYYIMSITRDRFRPY